MAARDDVIAAWLARGNRRGGHAQRLHAEMAVGHIHREVEKSFAADKLIDLWAIGLLSAPLVQTIADSFATEFQNAGGARGTPTSRNYGR